MEFDNQFEVPAPPEQVWAHLLDVEAVVPCMPGAELTETVDDRTWKGKVTIKLGAVSLTFKGTVSMTERDDDAKRVALDAKGMEARGKGQATATVTSTMTATDDGGTRVDMHTDLSLSGQAAQMGRGMIGDVSQRLASEFAECVAEELTAQPTSGAAAAAGGTGATGDTAGTTGTGEVAGTAAGTERGTTGGAAAGGQTRSSTHRKEIGGIRLTLWAVWRAIKRGARRLARREES